LAILFCIIPSNNIKDAIANLLSKYTLKKKEKKTARSDSLMRESKNMKNLKTLFLIVRLEMK